MLVLSRKLNESIVIDGKVVVTVLELRGDQVRLGVTAPREIPVHRAELLVAHCVRHAQGGRSLPPGERRSGRMAEIEAAKAAAARHALSMLESLLPEASVD